MPLPHSALSWILSEVETPACKSSFVDTTLKHLIPLVVSLAKFVPPSVSLLAKLVFFLKLPQNTKNQAMILVTYLAHFFVYILGVPRNQTGFFLGILKNKKKILKPIFYPEI